MDNRRTNPLKPVFIYTEPGMGYRLSEENSR
jgi:hypothetical protein